MSLFILFSQPFQCLWPFLRTLTSQLTVLSLEKKILVLSLIYFKKEIMLKSPYYPRQSTNLIQSSSEYW